MEWFTIDVGDITVVGSSQFACATLCATCAALCFVLQEATGNYSQVDKLWSILPAVYALIFWAFPSSNALQKPVISAEEPDQRIDLMAFCALAWSVRLTFNFWRRGGYTWPVWAGEEDYRWSILRSKITNKLSWTIFSFGFIAIYQNILLLLIAVPAGVAAMHRSPLTTFDWALFTSFLGFVLIETLADNHQYAFQTKKHALRKQKQVLLTGDFKRGFLTTGLFAYCRHPNYAAEQALWIVFHLFGASAKLSSGATLSSALTNAGGLGCALLVLLFQGSALFSEGVTATKYPDYKTYQRQVPKFIPTLTQTKFTPTI
eukprot:c6373_g1_i1.p1 GENE.c6373_g1_i1~~c6373_g1_i1.p1  ORF type:complete len:328 (-),score=62.13 c6373_g1_i1:33-983(-)